MCRKVQNLEFCLFWPVFYPAFQHCFILYSIFHFLNLIHSGTSLSVYIIYVNMTYEMNQVGNEMNQVDDPFDEFDLVNEYEAF
jgi:hypothetical protein